MCKQELQPQDPTPACGRAPARSHQLTRTKVDADARNLTSLGGGVVSQVTLGRGSEPVSLSKAAYCHVAGQCRPWEPARQRRPLAGHENLHGAATPLVFGSVGLGRTQKRDALHVSLSGKLPDASHKSSGCGLWLFLARTLSLN